MIELIAYTVVIPSDLRTEISALEIFCFRKILYVHLQVEMMHCEYNFIKPDIFTVGNKTIKWRSLYLSIIKVLEIVPLFLNPSKNYEYIAAGFVI